MKYFLLFSFCFMLFSAPLATFGALNTESECKNAEGDTYCSVKCVVGGGGELFIGTCSDNWFLTECCKKTNIKDEASCNAETASCSGKQSCPADSVRVGNCDSQSWCCKSNKDIVYPGNETPSITPKAEFNYVPLEPIPGISPESSSTLKGFLEGLYLFALWSAGIASLFMIGIGGFWYITSAGNTSRVGEAKNIIGNALWGLLVVFIAWLILYVINPDLVRVDLTSLNGLQVSAGYDDVAQWDGTPIDGGGVVGTGNCTGYSLSGPTCVLLSEALQTFLTCVRQQVPSNISMTITSITSNGLVNGPEDLEQSALCCGKQTSPCPHGPNSCHHGCKTTNKGYSYAVDIAMNAGNPNYCTIAEAAENCGAKEKFGPRTTGAECGNIRAIEGHSGHFHFSVGCPP